MNETKPQPPDFELSDYDDTYDYRGFDISLLAIGYKRYNFCLLELLGTAGTFCLFDVAIGDWNRALVGYNPRPIIDSKPGQTFSMFEIEHYSVDLFFMRFLIKKKPAKP